VVLSKSMSRGLQRQIDLTTAVCQERLLSTHVRHVLAVVDLVSDDLPFDDALDIYVRILGLTPEQARNVGSRALASLGQRGGLPRVEDLDFDQPPPQEEKPSKEVGRPEAMFSRLRRRIRGRVQDELRMRINLAAARAEDQLLKTHVSNSLLFVKAANEEISDPEAIELYLETMAIPEGVADVIYNRALRTIADDVLPPLPTPKADSAREGVPSAAASDSASGESSS